MWTAAHLAGAAVSFRYCRRPHEMVGWLVGRPVGLAVVGFAVDGDIVGLPLLGEIEGEVVGSLLVGDALGRPVGDALGQLSQAHTRAPAT